MAQNEAPSAPQREFQFVDLQTGRLTQYGVSILDEYWRQIAAGFTTVPCVSSTAANLITLKPRLHEEGSRTYGAGMTFTAIADASTTGPVTALVKSGTKALSTVKVYKDGGATQAGNGDIVAGRLYQFIYEPSLDTGAGGLVLK
jgi:hypothetical protein